MGQSRRTGANWYLDPETGGTRYWDGYQWTGDVRPKRRRFASKAFHPVRGAILSFLAIMFLLTAFSSSSPETESLDLKGRFLAVIISIGLVTIAVYSFRGQGLTDKQLRNNLEEQNRVLASRRAAANYHSVVRQPTYHGNQAQLDAARISAISDPRTAQSLANLHALLYSRIITDTEFQTAKYRLLGDAPVIPNAQVGSLQQNSQLDPVQQLERLAQLHYTGVLGDQEYAIAKSRIIGYQ